MRSPGRLLVALSALLTIGWAPAASGEDWERKLEDCRIDNAPRIVLCSSGLDLGGAAARAVCESQNKAAQDAAGKRIDDCQAQVERERQAQANLEKERLEEKHRREQAEAAAKASQAEDGQAPTQDMQSVHLSLSTSTLPKGEAAGRAIASGFVGAWSMKWSSASSSVVRFSPDTA